MKHVTEGNCPHVDETGSPLEARALFVQAVDTAGDNSGWRWRVYTTDYARQKTNIQTLHPTGTMIGTTTNTFTSGVNFTVSTAGFGTRLEGCKLYILDGTHAGLSATIKVKSSGTVLTLDSTDAANLYGVPVGSRYGISPMYFRWVGHQLGIENDNGVPFGSDSDFFLVRQAESLSCNFVDVDPEEVIIGRDTKDARFRGLLYRGTEREPRVKEFPVNSDGTKMESIVEGASQVYAPMSPVSEVLDGGAGRFGYSGTTLFPGVEVFVPGLDFRLLSVSVEGTIKDRNT
jgi:hypothetical protein